MELSSRREFLKNGSRSIATGLMLQQVSWRAAFAGMPQRGPAKSVISLDRDWRFGPGANPSGLQFVDLPHCVAELSWQGWAPASWEQMWMYRRSFERPFSKAAKQRAFLHFDGVMTGCSPVLNGHALEPNLGGFLPFEREVTQLLEQNNELELHVDGRWLKVPPQGSPEGTTQVDYLMPAGIHRSVNLVVLPETFISDIFAKPVDVLKANRRVEVTCTIDSGSAAPERLKLEAVLLDGAEEVSRQSTELTTRGSGTETAQVVLTGLSKVKLWSPDSPKLYTVRVALTGPNGVQHEYVSRIGFREARFEVDGFFLNGKRTRIFGLNRHELFPYVGFAMPARVMQRDAATLRRQFNCNMVRCSHYPQTEAFLDACDELGLMVWQEVPGWQYIGDQSWQDLVVRDTRKMILRDRNHASIIVWGVRVNESPNNVPLYTRTKKVAKELDDSRQTTGTMTHYSTENWLQEVFAYDDYHSEPDGTVGMRPAIPGVPFLFAEGVGQYQYEHGKGFKQYYRRAGDRKIQEGQPRYHAQGHDRAARDPRCAGLIAWCAYDYGSLHTGYNALKCPGVVDTFRIPKLGAAFYLSQVSPQVRAVIEPGFYFDFSPEAQGGPGNKAHIFSNCERLVVRVGDQQPMTIEPDRKSYPNLPFPPFVVDLSNVPENHPDLRIEGYAGSRLVLTRSFSADRSKDQLYLAVDDPEIANDGKDATRVWFSVCDRYGAPCPSIEGTVTLDIEGAAEMIGDHSFLLADTGGVGAVWVKSKTPKGGEVRVRATHPRLATRSVSLRVKTN